VYKYAITAGAALLLSASFLGASLDASGADGAPASAAPPAPLTIDALLGGQRLVNASLSPDGHYLAMIISEGEHSYVAVKSLSDATPARPVLRADPSQHLEPRLCRWSGPTRMVCIVNGMAKDTGGFVGRFVEVAADGSELHVLRLNRGPNAADRDRYVMSVIDYIQTSPDEILIRVIPMSTIPGIDERDFNSGAARYNLVTGEFTEGYKPQRYMAALVADGAGEVRLLGGGRDATSAAGYIYTARGLPLGQSQWRDLTRLAPYGATSFWSTCCVTRDTNDGYMLFQHGDRLALWRVDLADTRDPELALGDADRDIGRVLVNEDQQLLGAHLEGRTGGPTYLTPQAQAMSRELEQLLPGLWHYLVSTTPDMKMAVVLSWNATQAPSWFLLDLRGATPKVGRIGSLIPGLRGRTPGQIGETHFTTAAGKRALMDLVTPSTRGPAPPPLILWLTTGGDPSASAHTNHFTVEGESGYSLIAQFLASHGYVVAFPHLQESRATIEAWQYAFADWGGAVYDEVLAAEHAALAETGADPARVCIIGEGYAGYTALVAAFRHGEGLRCVATINGISELAPLRKRVMQEGSYLTAGQKARFADIKYDEPFAPRAHASQAHVPVLLMQTDLKLDSIGFFDTDTDQGREMSEALRKAGKAQALVLTHSIDEAYQREVLAALDAFLGKVDPVAP
jgi:dienelactone hydrolase